jgi:hypothetical protein
MDLNANTEKLRAYLDSPEGKKETEEYFGKIASKKAILVYQLEKFHNRYKDRLDEVIEHIQKKYQSKAYRDREYDKLQREPNESLYSFLFDYAEKYCAECRERQYYNDFTGSAYYLGSYVIQVIYGQGSAIIFEKQKNPPIITTGTDKMRDFLRDVNDLCKKYKYTIQPTELVFHDETPTISIVDDSEEFKVSFINGDEIKD